MGGRELSRFGVISKLSFSKSTKIEVEFCHISWFFVFASTSPLESFWALSVAEFDSAANKAARVG